MFSGELDFPANRSGIGSSFFRAFLGLFISFVATHGLRSFDKLRAGCGLRSFAVPRL
jgi:hypothetical protein